MRWLSQFWGLWAKEWREVSVARATLVLALAIGPLVGHAYITAVTTYAEASGIGGTTAALSQGLSPLDGLVVPTFGAYALAVALLFPFVAIRVVSAEKESGALALMLQSRSHVSALVLAKFKVLLSLWIALWIPGFAALVLWSLHGGHLDAGETATVLAGHLLRGALTAAAAMMVAAVADGAATATVVTLAVTLGTWALDFVAQIKGGVAEALAAFTPDAALRTFEHGELSVAVIGVTAVITVALLCLCGTWLHTGHGRQQRWGTSVFIVTVAVCIGVIVSRLYGSVDTSEDRRNSFSVRDEAALASIREPLTVTVHLAPEDPRLADLERGALHKLRRVMRNMDVHYVSRGTTGLFERGAAGASGSTRDSDYGEVWYQIGARRAMSRSSIEEVVLATVYEVAAVTAPVARADSANISDSAYPGWPLAIRPVWAAPLFYLVWPFCTLLLWSWNRRRASVA